MDLGLNHLVTKFRIYETMEEQRALLDSLMGFNRNKDREGGDITDFRDDRICKFYLLGMCPYDMFINTKVDEGRCPKIHSDTLKEKFEASSDPYIFDSLVEREFTARLNEIDRTIRRSRTRVEDDKGDGNAVAEANPELLKVQADIERYTADAEKAADNGDIDHAQELMTIVDNLTQEKTKIAERITEERKALMQRTGVDLNKKLRVCDICGSFLSILDSDKRLADHFIGKQHAGCQIMRDYLEEIKKRKESNKSSPRSYTTTTTTTAAADFNEDLRRRNVTQDRSSRDRDRYTSGGSDSRNSGRSYVDNNESNRDRDRSSTYSRHRDYYHHPPSSTSSASFSSYDRYNRDYSDDRRYRGGGGGDDDRDYRRRERYDSRDRGGRGDRNYDKR